MPWVLLLFPILLGIIVGAFFVFIAFEERKISCLLGGVFGILLGISCIVWAVWSNNTERVLASEETFQVQELCYKNCRKVQVILIPDASGNPKIVNLTEVARQTFPAQSMVCRKTYQTTYLWLDWHSTRFDLRDRYELAK